MKKGVTVKELGKNLTLPIITENTKDAIDIISFYDLENKEFDFIAQNGIAGPGKKNLFMYEYIENKSTISKIPLLIRELPVLRNQKTEGWWRFSWNHYFYDQAIYPYDSSYNRWDELISKLNIKIYNWRHLGDSILICLQKPMDSALNRLHQSNVSYETYCVNLIDKIKKISDRKIIVRGHPKDPTNLALTIKKQFPTIEISQNISIFDDLDQSYCMITYNSTSSIESVLYGIPTITLDSSAVARDVTYHSIEQIECQNFLDREEWFKKIAFMQWSTEEIKNGYLWEILKEKVWK